ncbi:MULTISPECIES: DUF2157 domain-containing protein [unclassified Psychrobacter]|uniref:DUF2157 domain-containing protein n=1 Tax=unclassified Psychrobacter TaxID=196806 RepID=UPI0025B45C5B|nr:MULTISPECIES: DUF2157 domain-containing protein [unclassified Psychrobacter]MDN3453541.1 DUF2157 domain-containing protein [Psychrobacter sp. APC 3350]MDN3502586.1 DUF2157 domain-containing protein [Psychrobacter sp. 5A.1]
MSQPRRTIEHLLKQGILPLAHADDAAIHLEVYPTKRFWLAFFDKASLIIGAVALVLSLVFFIAYNWLNMGKIGKFALVEGALVVTIALYAALAFRQKFRLIQQLLLLIASILTGSLLALFGQVYQTGADTWQLFFGWAVLIIPWVIIARFPALWLLWLGLINALTLFYIDTALFFGLDYYDQDFWQFTIITVINFIAFYLWLECFEKKRLAGISDLSSSRITSSIQSNSINSNTVNSTSAASKSSLHWSTYVVALVSTYTITYLAISTIFDDRNIQLFWVANALWLGWCGFMYGQFRRRRVDLLMLTYLSFSIISVVMWWVGEWLLDDFDAGGFLFLALSLIGLSSAAVIWLRKVSRLDNANQTRTTNKGADHE